jgi:hypothetical protein
MAKKRVLSEPPVILRALLIKSGDPDLDGRVFLQDVSVVIKLSRPELDRINKALASGSERVEIATENVAYTAVSR